MTEMSAGDGTLMDEQDPARRTVLIVDDDEEIRHVLRLLCEMDGVEAVPMALHQQPAFIILDYRMPGRNGDVTAEMIRSIAPDSKIVAFSAVLDSKPAWSDSYLNKERISEIAPLLERLIF
jgi:DNA-binding NtrC family response regulator